VDDPGHGLNAAIQAAENSVGLAGPRAALLADLPALRPADLSAALSAARSGRAFLRDHGGTGTTLLTAAAGVALGPASGPVGRGPRRLPRRELAGDFRASPRRGHPGDLIAATALGLGPRTAAASTGTLPPMQGTVASFDPASRTPPCSSTTGRSYPWPGRPSTRRASGCFAFGQRVTLVKGRTGR